MQKYTNRSREVFTAASWAASDNVMLVSFSKLLSLAISAEDRSFTCMYLWSHWNYMNTTCAWVKMQPTQKYIYSNLFTNMRLVFHLPPAQPVWLTFDPLIRRRHVTAYSAERFSYPVRMRWRQQRLSTLYQRVKKTPRSRARAWPAKAVCHREYLLV